MPAAQSRPPNESQPNLQARPDLRPSGNGHKRPRYDAVVKRSRIEHIKMLMSELKWNTKVARQLGEAWGKSGETIGNYAAVASREVLSDVADRETVTRDVGVVLRRSMLKAERENAYRAVDRFANTWMKLAGIMAERDGQAPTTQVSFQQMFQVVPAESQQGAEERKLTTPAMKTMFAGIVQDKKAPELAHVQTVDREVEPAK